MLKPNRGDVSGPRTDTTGLENLFDVTASYDNADSSQKRTIEVSISEAAKRLETSERTIWRRIHRGELKSRTKGNKRIVKIPVYLPEATVDSDGHTTWHDTPAKASALVDLQALLRDLQSANYRIGYLESQLHSNQEQVKLLPDLQAKAIELENLRVRLAATDTELQHIKSRWWCRLWCWLTGK